MTEQRILSPDGTQFWDGSAWQPVPATPLSPDGTHRWDGNAWLPVQAASHGSSADGGQDAHATPPSGGAPHGLAAQAVPAGAAGGGGQPDNTWGANKWAWRIALSPLAFLGASLLLGQGYPTWAPLAAGATIAIAATFFVDMDVKSLKARGVHAEQSFTALVLLLYVIGAPVYLIHRTTKARTSALIPVAWFVCAAVTFGGLALSGGVLPSLGGSNVDVTSIELGIEDALSENGISDAVVACPSDASYGDGDMVICDATSPGEGDFEISLNMRNDGYFEWQVQ